MFRQSRSSRVYWIQLSAPLATISRCFGSLNSLIITCSQEAEFSYCAVQPMRLGFFPIGSGIFASVPVLLLMKLATS